MNSLSHGWMYLQSARTHAGDTTQPKCQTS
jgi:hypothetical protein